MKAINESELDVALNKLESIKKIAQTWKEDSPELLIRIIMNSILEVIDE